jgi:uncharacterized protein (TIRG00374 family)
VTLKRDESIGDAATNRTSARGLIWRALIGLAGSAFFLFLLLRRVQLDELGNALGGVEWLWVVLAALPFAGGLWVRALRWQLVLRPSVMISASEATSLVVIGYAANNLLPIRSGEVVRAVLVERLTGAARMLVLGTIVVERVFDGLVLALFLAVALAAAGSNETLQLLAVIAAVGFSVATLILAWVAVRPAHAGSQLVRLLRFVPTRFRDPARGWLGSFLGGLGQLRGVGSWSMVFGATVASWGLEAVAYWLVGEAFGLGLDPWLYLGVAGAANLAIAAPATAGGVGPFEFFAREVLVVFGVVSATATAYALVLHALVLVPVVLAGLALLWQRHLGPAVLANPERALPAIEGAETPR